MPAYFHRATCIHHPSCYPHYARLFQDVVESENSQSEFYPFFVHKYVVVGFVWYTANFLVVYTWYGWKRTRGRVLHTNVLFMCLGFVESLLWATLGVHNRIGYLGTLLCYIWYAPTLLSSMHPLTNHTSITSNDAGTIVAFFVVIS